MQRIAFERDDTIWISNADGTGAKKLADGNLPDISPDGTRIAFNTNEPGTRSPVRHIAVVEIASGDLTVFKDIPSDNCFGPIWSPDGSALLFNIYMEDDWQLGFVKSDGSEFRIVKKAAAKGRSYGAPCWAANGSRFSAMILIGSINSIWMATSRKAGKYTQSLRTAT